MSAPLKLRDGDRLVLASHNKGKLKEFQELFEPFGLELMLLEVMRLEAKASGS